MLNMIKGCSIADASRLNSGYEKTDSGYIANVDSEKICGLIEDFIELQNDRVFLFLEVPTNAADEPVNEAGDIESFHMDIYYWDGLTKEFAIGFLQKNHELLIHDGMSRFGFGSHGGNNEIILEQYNVVRIYTGDHGLYEGMFERHGVPEVEELLTAWNFFSAETPGECFLYDYNGKTIYDFVEFLKPYGLYFAERREK